jgi:hypothetical protein
VNFFGHAAVALRVHTGSAHEQAATVIGAMMPDFTSMLRVRVPSSEDKNYEHGVRVHHLTDDVFHDCEPFRALSTQSFEYLTSPDVARVLDRGSARALAHVGVELLLDQHLGAEATLRERYLEALAHDATFGSLHYAHAHDSARFDELRRFLLGPARDFHRASSADTGERLFRILARRPRLAFTREALPVVVEWLERTSPQAAAVAHLTLAHVADAVRGRL